MPRILCPLALPVRFFALLSPGRRRGGVNGRRGRVHRGERVTLRLPNGDTRRIAWADLALVPSAPPIVTLPLASPRPSPYHAREAPPAAPDEHELSGASLAFGVHPHLVPRATLGLAHALNNGDYGSAHPDSGPRISDVPLTGIFSALWAFERERRSRCRWALGAS